jgi:hypothetical protein
MSLEQNKQAGLESSRYSIPATRWELIESSPRILSIGRRMTIPIDLIGVSEAPQR